ncbi:MAG: ArsR/SmtB family transcription factor [Acidimicrobiia bacterium]
MKELDQSTADEYASWFRCLADGTRVRVLNIVANSEHPMTVGEIVEVIGKSQSTVSRHLQILAEERFVLSEPDGVRTLVKVNEACMVALPEAAEAIMARARVPR